MTKDPNKFGLHEDCPGCNRLWRELLNQDKILEQHRVLIENLRTKLKGKENGE